MGDVWYGSSRSGARLWGDTGAVQPSRHRQCLFRHGKLWQQRLIPLAPESFPVSLIQGFDPHERAPRKVLDGMDLYCGGGSFGRGLEEGGAVRNKWAVDYNREAIHTYHANLQDPDGMSLYFGSVNDILAAGIRGHFGEHVPEPGKVDFISAGSPCQGFSNVNRDRRTDESLRNSSLVASVAAFIDFYRPKFALLENVLSMAAKGPNKQDESVFSQLLCALVGMGYQVQQFNLDAWSFGSPQNRSRLFVSIAAPGLELPPHPALSHSHPNSKGARSIGKASNGQPLGCDALKRRHSDTSLLPRARAISPGLGTAPVRRASRTRTTERCSARSRPSGSS